MSQAFKAAAREMAKARREVRLQESLTRSSVSIKIAGGSPTTRKASLEREPSLTICPLREPEIAIGEKSQIERWFKAIVKLKKALRRISNEVAERAN